MSDDIFWTPASELSRSFRRKELSPVELVDHVLKRAERLQPHLNFLVLIDASGARAAARESEARWMKGEPLSPLDGVPTSIKDTTPVKGWPTRSAPTPPTKRRPSEDAPIVARLRAAGLPILGKSTDARVRLEGADRFAVAGHHAQPVEPRPFARRLVGRRLVDDRRRRGTVQPRQRRRRLDPHPRGPHRPGRAEAVLRPHPAIPGRFAVRRRRQPGRAGAQRARHGAGAECHRRPRPARLALAAGRGPRLHDRPRRGRARLADRPQPRLRPRQSRPRGPRAGRSGGQALRGARRACRGRRSADRAAAEFLRAAVDRQLRHPPAPDPDPAARQARSRLPRRGGEGPVDHPGRLRQRPTRPSRSSRATWPSGTRSTTCCWRR